jgi:hypothetical protein
VGVLHARVANTGDDSSLVACLVGHVVDGQSVLRKECG